MATAGPVVVSEKEKYIEQAYYIRYKLLIDEYGTDVLRKMFDQHYPPATLAKDLGLSKAMKKLDPLIKTKIINAEQEKLLYPKNGTPSSENFDITLLVILVRNLCGLDDRAKCWEKNPKPGDVSNEADVARIRNARNEMSHGKHLLEKQEFDNRWGTLDLVLQRLSRGILGLSDLPDHINALKTRNLDVMSSQLRALKSKTPDFFSRYVLNEHYVETEKYREAKAIFLDKRVIILTGHPGEGKTTMAAQLANEVSNEKSCLILSSPVDWSHVDLELEIFDTIIIDDIFGAGAIDQLLVKDWERRLKEVERASTENHKLNVIITTRHYILEEAMQTISQLPMLQDEYTVLLSSDTLSEKEKIGIISSKIQMSGRDKIDEMKMREYVNKSTLLYGRSITRRYEDFGFPECADMFVRNDSIYSLGSEFFKQPNAFFKKILEELYKGESDESKFFALILVWMHSSRLSSRDVSLSAPAQKIREIAQSFGFEWNRQMVRTVNAALINHRRGYLHYNESSEIYSFSHNVIGDMVGIVTMQDELVQEAVIKHCPRDFFMEHVTIGDIEESGYNVSITGPHIPTMVAKAVDLLTCKDGYTHRNKCLTSMFMEGIYIDSDHIVEPTHDLDIGIIKHPAFDNAGFVKVFMDYVVENHLTNKVFEVTFSATIFKYYDHINNKKICLTTFAALTETDKLVREVIKRKILSAENKDNILNLMLKTNSRDFDLMYYLHNNGAQVADTTINFAFLRISASYRANQIYLKKLIERNILSAEHKDNILNCMLKKHSRNFKLMHFLLNNGAQVADETIYFVVDETSAVFLGTSVSIFNTTAHQNANIYLKELSERNIFSAENKANILNHMLKTHNRDFELMSYLIDNGAQVADETIYRTIHEENVVLLGTLVSKVNTTAHQNATIYMKELIERNIFSAEKNANILNHMLKTHSRDFELMYYLIDNGAQVADETKYRAIYEENVVLLGTLVSILKTRENQKATIYLNKLIKRNIFSAEIIDNILKCMLHTNSKNIELMSYLIDNGAQVADGKIYRAIDKANIELLDTLLSILNTTALQKAAIYLKKEIINENPYRKATEIDLESVFNLVSRKRVSSLDMHVSAVARLK